VGPEGRARARLPLPREGAPDARYDLGRTNDEDSAIEDFAAAQELALDDFFTFSARRTEFLDPVLAGRANGTWDPRRRTWS
jgi:hypothetical protein